MSGDVGAPSRSKAGGSSPGAVVSADVGDETQRNFRYQHAYGVILLAGAYSGTKRFVTLYCEHHDDFLVCRADGAWEAFQVKTRGEGLPLWKITDGDVQNSIKRFVALDLAFPDSFDIFHFVSNVKVFRTEGSRDREKCLEFLLQAVAEVQTPQEVDAPWDEVLDHLAGFCGCDRPTLWSVLRRMRLVVGPGRDSFDAEVAHVHLGTLGPCKGFSPRQLNDLRDELIACVFRASSLQNDDPAKHLGSLKDNDPSNPRIAEKCLDPHVIDSVLQDLGRVPFRFLPTIPRPALGMAKSKSEVLRRKLAAGGIPDQFETMLNRALSAEQRLVELSYQDPERFEEVINQLVGVVKGECDEAQLEAATEPLPYGRKMLSDVFRRLRAVAKDRKEIVRGEEYECLAGVAALLTGECQVWWGPKFKIEGES
jgi:hypothetical protein